MWFFLIIVSISKQDNNLKRSDSVRSSNILISSNIDTPGLTDHSRKDSKQSSNSEVIINRRPNNFDNESIKKKIITEEDRKFSIIDIPSNIVQIRSCIRK